MVEDDPRTLSWRRAVRQLLAGWLMGPDCTGNHDFHVLRLRYALDAPLVRQRARHWRLGRVVVSLPVRRSGTRYGWRKWLPLLMLTGVRRFKEPHWFELDHGRCLRSRFPRQRWSIGLAIWRDDARGGHDGTHYNFCGDDLTRRDSTVLRTRNVGVKR